MDRICGIFSRPAKTFLLTRLDPSCLTEATKSQQFLLHQDRNFWLSRRHLSEGHCVLAQRWDVMEKPPCLALAPFGAIACSLVRVSDAAASSYQILFCLRLNTMKEPPLSEAASLRR